MGFFSALIGDIIRAKHISKDLKELGIDKLTKKQQKEVYKFAANGTPMHLLKQVIDHYIELNEKEKSRS